MWASYRTLLLRVAVAWGWMLLIILLLPLCVFLGLLEGIETWAQLSNRLRRAMMYGE